MSSKIAHQLHKTCASNIWRLIVFCWCSVIINVLSPILPAIASSPPLIDRVELFGYIDNYGNVSLANTPITSLPDPLVVEGFLNIAGTKITTLPASLTVKKYLNATYTPLVELAVVNIGGYINLTGSAVKKLAPNLKVNGDLSLVDTPIKSLPDNLYVAGNLYLYGTGISELPADLVVGKNLYIRGTSINKIPESVIVKGNIVK